ncbi:MAG: hypothetical protein U0271_19780 [Polyangiaceae bacterium]
MKREKRLTKREKKAVQGPGPAAQTHDHDHDHHHIHCTACGKHLDEDMFGSEPPAALWLTCEHRSTFASCASCADRTREILAEHDRTGQPVRHASAWH